ncbi:uncharacterized protein BJ171DRAFT_640204 [Polychytrium aggregatum]|uniref:uncharacterized protein n=1 Tax=Polychytrium aggregatum TaxID=110093 RepID=UPI0022FEF1C9|nr:uncharacterized protein BJ171DRAFT_640204 [Polychytrium aggregatum]KAI9207335.1 hypothetical protein BJ171DRAFT_640204 [Polychytrium aggregatum]
MSAFSRLSDLLPTPKPMAGNFTSMARAKVFARRLAGIAEARKVENLSLLGRVWEELLDEREEYIRMGRSFIDSATQVDDDILDLKLVEKMAAKFHEELDITTRMLAVHCNERLKENFRILEQTVRSKLAVLENEHRRKIRSVRKQCHKSLAEGVDKLYSQYQSYNEQQIQSKIKEHASKKKDMDLAIDRANRNLILMEHEMHRLEYAAARAFLLLKKKGVADVALLSKSSEMHEKFKVDQITAFYKQIFDGLEYKLHDLRTRKSNIEEILDVICPPVKPTTPSSLETSVTPQPGPLSTVAENAEGSTDIELASQMDYFQRVKERARMKQAVREKLGGSRVVFLDELLVSDSNPEKTRSATIWKDAEKTILRQAMRGFGVRLVESDDLGADQSFSARSSLVSSTSSKSESAKSIETPIEEEDEDAIMDRELRHMEDEFKSKIETLQKQSQAELDVFMKRKKKMIKSWDVKIDAIMHLTDPIHLARILQKQRMALEFTSDFFPRPRNARDQGCQCYIHGINFQTILRLEEQRRQEQEERERRARERREQLRLLQAQRIAESNIYGAKTMPKIQILAPIASFVEVSPESSPTDPVLSADLPGIIMTDASPTSDGIPTEASQIGGSAQPDATMEPGDETCALDTHPVESEPNLPAEITFQSNTSIATDLVDDTASSRQELYGGDSVIGSQFLISLEPDAIDSVSESSRVNSTAASQRASLVNVAATPPDVAGPPATQATRLSTSRRSVVKTAPPFQRKQSHRDSTYASHPDIKTAGSSKDIRKPSTAGATTAADEGEFFFADDEEPSPWNSSNP